MVSKRMCRKSRRLALVTGLALIGAAHAVKTVYWRLVNDGFLSAWWAVSEIRFYSDVNCNTDPIEPINVFSSGDLQAGTMGLYPESHSDPEMTGGGGCDAEPMDSRADQNPSCVRQPMPAKSYPAALAFDGNENSWWFSSQTGARTWIGAELQFANSADDLQCVEIKQSGHTRSSTKDLYVQKFLPTKCDTAYASDRCVPSIKMFNLNEAEFNRCFKKVEDVDGMFKHWYFDYAACKNVDSSQNSLNAEQDFTTTGAFQFSVNDDQFENLLVNGAIVGVKVVSSPTGEFFNFGDRTITQVTDSSGNTKILTSLDDLSNFCATHPSNCGSSTFKIAAPTAALNPSGTTGTTSATEVEQNFQEQFFLVSREMRLVLLFLETS